jgi:FkbM family methyltransferase
MIGLGSRNSSTGGIQHMAMGGWRQAIRSLKNAAKKVHFRVRRDAVSGHLYYMIEGKRAYVRSAGDCMRAKHLRYAFDEIFYKHYLPSGEDCVVDFGAGFGFEAILLAERSPQARYIAVEIQPWIYECLCMTLSQLPRGFHAFGRFVGEAESIRLHPTRSGIDVYTESEGPVTVEGITWDGFRERFGIDKVDLLKVNIEGGERQLLDHIDLSDVDRLIVSTHDFRADRGQGEHFRTRSHVEGRLRSAGFDLIDIDGPQDWMRGWLYASRTP